MTTNPTTRSTARADLLLKMVAATEYLLDLFGEMEQTASAGSVVFRGGVKYAATKFKAELERAEGIVTKYQDSDRVEAVDQLSESYSLVANLFDLQLQAGRKLTPDAKAMLSTELSGVFEKWGLEV